MRIFLGYKVNSKVKSISVLFKVKKIAMDAVLVMQFVRNGY